MISKKEITKFIDDVCVELKISTPNIVYVDKLETPTQMADVNINTNEIRLKRKIDNQFDQIFAVAHELRHIYQHQYGLLDMDKYISDKSNIIKYNMQEVEIDANAYAGYIMITKFRVKPLFDNLPTIVKNRIYEKIQDFLGV